MKERIGNVERVSDGESGSGPVTVIGRGMFKPESDMSKFFGLPIETETGQVWRATFLYSRMVA